MCNSVSPLMYENNNCVVAVAAFKHSKPLLCPFTKDPDKISKVKIIFSMIVKDGLRQYDIPIKPSKCFFYTDLE